MDRLICLLYLTMSTHVTGPANQCSVLTVGINLTSVAWIQAYSNKISVEYKRLTSNLSSAVSCSYYRMTKESSAPGHWVIAGWNLSLPRECERSRPPESGVSPLASASNPLATLVGVTIPMPSEFGPPVDGSGSTVEEKAVLRLPLALFQLMT